jgi:putative transposase
MTRVRLTPGLHLWWHNCEYVIKQKTQEKFQLLNEATGQTTWLTEKQLVQSFFAHELTLKNPVEDQTVQSYQEADYAQIPDSLKAEAGRKKKYIKAVLDQNLETYTPASLSPIIQQVALMVEDSHPPSPITLYRWLKDYHHSGDDIRSLIPRHQAKGNYDPKITPEVLQLISEVVTEVYLNLSRPSIASIYDVIICRIKSENVLRKSLGQNPLKNPHRSTIYRQIKKLDPIDKAIGRYGQRTASLMYEPIQLGPRPTRPGERVEIDHTLLPLFVVDLKTRIPIGTPSLTSAVDKYSGVIVGYYLSFEPFSSLSVMQCLKHTIRPKDYIKEKFPSVKKEWNVYGLMEVLVVDNGKEFYSKHFQDACQQLGITIQYTPPYMPWYKSSVERTFGSYNTQLLKGQPGTFLQEFAREYNYNPRENAVVSLEALQEMIHIFIVDIHNQSSHPQLLAPRAEVWSQAIAKYPPSLPTSLQDLRVLVGAIEKRVISRKGVELYGLYYNSPELAQLRSNYEPEDNRRKDGKRTREKATIKYDPTNLETIYVLDPTTHQFMIVPAVNQEYTQGLTLWQHRVIKNLAAMSAKRVDLVALALAKQKIQEIVEREWQQSHRGKASKSMARWLKIGLDENKGEQFSASTETLKEPARIATPETDRELTNFFQPSPSIRGISDLGNAYNREPNLSETYPLSIEVSKQEEIREIVDTDKSSLKKSKQKLSGKQLPTSVNSEQLAPLPLESESVERTDEWKPDLTGWGVSIDLPTRGK